MRYFVELSYNGKNYHGWQIQPNAISVQETMGKAFSVYFQEEISLLGCGRTDTGVHASQFFAQFETDKNVDVDLACYSLNNMLPKDISLKRIFIVADDAHTRFSATSRTYQYFIHFNKDPFIGEHSYRFYQKLDQDKMNLACKTLFEFEDFTSFSKIHSESKTNICKILQAEWKPFGNGIVFTIQADRFLRNMVRAIVGTMLDIGRGKLEVEEIKDIILKKDRGEAGTSVPADALFLYKIEYPEGMI